MKTPTERAAEAMAIEPEMAGTHLLPDGRLVSVALARKLRSEACEALVTLDDGARPAGTLYPQLVADAKRSGFSSAGARTFARNRLQDYAAMVVEVAPRA